MKNISIAVLLWICIFTINGAFAHEPSDTLTEFIDRFTITEMYLMDIIRDTVIDIDEEYTKEFYMERMELLEDGSCFHSINVYGEKSFIAFTYGNPIKCIGLKRDEYVLERQCFDGKMRSSIIEDTTALIFVFERLASPDDHANKYREYVSFTYYFDSSALQAYGYKVASNYDPKYLVEESEKTAAQFQKEGDIEVEGENYTQAINLYSQAIDLDSTSGELYYSRGNAWYYLNQLDAALDDLQTSILLDSTLTSPYVLMGIIYRDKEQHEAAIEILSKGIELDPDLWFAYQIRGLSKAYLLNLSGAFSDFDKAIELEPNNWDLYLFRGSSRFLAFEELHQAMDDFNKAISLYSESGEAYYLRGKLRFLLDDADGGCSDLRKAIELGYEKAAKSLEEECN